MFADCLGAEQCVVLDEDFLPVADIDFSVDVVLAGAHGADVFVFVVFVLLHFSLFFIGLVIIDVLLFLSSESFQDIVILLEAHVFLSGRE